MFAGIKRLCYRGITLAEIKVMESRLLKLFAISGIAMLMSGCTKHFSLQDCQSTSWENEGFKDGANGRAKRDLSTAIKDCNKHEFPVDLDGYGKGYYAGQKQYCSPENAQRIGALGQDYSNVCLPDIMPSFLASYRKGLRTFCVPLNGYELGKAGKEMPTFCAPDQLNAFREGYVEGKHLYLKIKDVQDEINDVDDKIADKHSIINDLNLDIKALEKQITTGAGEQGRSLTQEAIVNINSTILQKRITIQSVNVLLKDLKEHRGDLNRRLLDLQYAD